MIASLTRVIQTIQKASNKIFAQTNNFLWLPVTFNEKLWKRGEEISKIIYYLLIIFLIAKVKEGLNLHFLFISCEFSVRHDLQSNEVF